MPDLIEVVSKRTGRKLTIPRARYERHSHLFKLPPSKRAGARPKAAKSTTPKPAKPVTTAATDDKEAADGAQTEPRTN